MDDDPGWRIFRKRRDGQVVPLMAMRTIFFAMSMGVFLFGLVVVMNIASAKSSPDDPPVVMAVVILGIGVLVQLAARKFVRPLDVSSEQALQASYRGRYIIWTAAAEAAGLAGFVAALVVVQWWVLVIAALISGVGLYLAAPTEAAVQRDEERLQAQGSRYSLTAVLRRPWSLEQPSGT